MALAVSSSEARHSGWFDAPGGRTGVDVIPKLGDRARGSPDLGTIGVTMGPAAAAQRVGANELLRVHILIHAAVTTGASR